MELVGGKKKLRKKMYRSILSEDEIFTRDIPSQNIQRGNGLMLVSIGKILQSLEGCACPMGALSREFLKKLQLAENEIALIDMEAGVEHFGRGVDESIDDVLLTVEPSFESITVAEKIKSLAVGIDKNVRAILNKIDSENMAFRLESELTSRGIEVIGFVPNDVAVFEACLEGRPLSQDRAFHAAGKILDLLLSKSNKLLVTFKSCGKVSIFNKVSDRPIPSRRYPSCYDEVTNL